MRSRGLRRAASQAGLIAALLAVFTVCATGAGTCALLLDLVGLSEHGDHRPDEMSGGQMQRVAIARALAGSPRLLIADEPTGQLDTETGLAVMALIRGVVEAEGMTAIVSTHDPVMIALADRVLRIEDGVLVDG